MRIIGALAVCLALAGCSAAIKLAYNSFPDVSYWWLDRYFDFTDAQSVKVREEMARLQRWHRQQELPRYVDLLRRTEQMAAGEITPGQACAVVDEGRQRLQALADEARPALVSVAASFGPEQFQHLARRYERTNEEFRRDWIDAAPDKRLDKRYEQFEGRLEMVYGRLLPDQRTWLRQQLEASVFDARQLLAERQRRQADTLQVLRGLQARELPAVEAQRQMAGLIERSQRSPDPAARRHQEQLAQETCRIVAGMHQRATPQQRTHAQGRLRGYIKDLTDLSRS